MISDAFMGHSQLALQAISERGWLLTKAAEPVTSALMTSANVRDFIDAPNE